MSADAAKRWLGAHERLSHPDAQGVALVTSALLALSGDSSGAEEAMRTALGTTSGDEEWKTPGREWFIDLVQRASH